MVFVLFTRVLFRKALRFDPRNIAAVMALQERRAITDPWLLARCMGVLFGVIAGFGLHTVVHVEPSIIALVGAGVMLLVSGADVTDVLSFWRFTKYGIVVTALSTLMAWVYVWLRYFN
ncbi:hypothetical protein [Actinomadura sp. HBU206391]|uniref:hypothetical protein n=1 Tax=Actinomadura sp. HBU206391 TaxID=2731692 RepID=UPI002905C623|nr:hypothetical protein [Actinomadura sp. HBU206391]